MRRRLVVVPAFFLSVIALVAQPPAPFRIDEATIAQVETAIRGGGPSRTAQFNIRYDF